MLLNTSDIYSSIKGTTGNALPVVRQPELPGAAVDDQIDESAMDD